MISCRARALWISKTSHRKDLAAGPKATKHRLLCHLYGLMWFPIAMQILFSQYVHHSFDIWMRCWESSGMFLTGGKLSIHCSFTHQTHVNICRPAVEDFSIHTVYTSTEFWLVGLDVRKSVSWPYHMISRHATQRVSFAGSNVSCADLRCSLGGPTVFGYGKLERIPWVS